MVIKRLALYNFGVYEGENIFQLHGEKPVVLIGGLNGRGKTTFLEAVLIALYGVNSFAYQESQYKKQNQYGRYLKSFVNRNSASKECFVELEFEMEDSDRDTYVIKREWNGSGERVRENISVTKNNRPNEFLAKNWAMFIEDVLPSRLSNFFFFDGEKIAELALDNSDEKMKESVKAMLGLTVLDSLDGDLSRIISRLNKKNAGNGSLEKLESLRTQKEKSQVDLEKIDSDIYHYNEKIKQLQDKIESLNVEFSVKGGDAARHREELLKKAASVSADLTHENDRLISYAADILPLCLVKDFLCDINENAKREQKNQLSTEVLSQISLLYEQFGDESVDVNHFVSFVKKELSGHNSEGVFNLSNNDLILLQGLLDGKLDEQKKAMEAGLQRQNNLEKTANETESYLSADVDEQELKTIQNSIKKLEKEQVDIKIQLSILNQKRTNINGAYLKASSEFSKYVSIVLHDLEVSDSDERTIKYAYMAKEILKQYKVKLQAKKVRHFGDVVTICYKQLANKKTLISNVKMDPFSLQLTYVNGNGIEIPKEKLSAGEKQLMVISLLWALAQCSKKKLPVIIDTPLSRMDSEHRTALIKNYFPNASNQTIILSTDTEITNEYYQMLKDNIGDEFYLEYHEDTQSTTIHRGYFQGKNA